MDRTAYSRALRAAAQVSFVALAGCSSEGIPSGARGPATGPSSAQNSTPVPSTTAPPASSSSTATSPDAGSDATVVSDAAIGVSEATCDATLKEFFPKGDDTWWENPTLSDPTLVACCGKRATALDPNDFKAQDEYRASGCCHVQNIDPGMACTPWGPPVPPSIAGWLRSMNETTVEAA